MESFGITDPEFSQPPLFATHRGRWFWRGRIEFAVAVIKSVNPRRKTDINDATCLAAMSFTVQASAYTRNARAARLRFSP